MRYTKQGACDMSAEGCRASWGTLAHPLQPPAPLTSHSLLLADLKVPTGQPCSAAGQQVRGGGMAQVQVNPALLQWPAGECMLCSLP